jgi:signal transduction histidine kinase
MPREAVSSRVSSTRPPRANAAHTIARVLVVDDDPRLLMALSEMLAVTMPTLAVDTSSSAQRALFKIEQVDYDVIVSDVRMPELSGIELLERARKLRSDALVILITGADTPDVTLRALRGGAYDFIAKPVDPLYFRMALERALETRALRREVESRRLALERYAEELEETVERRTHDLIEASRLKDEFLATVSHELRTPLTPILGWARLLRAGRLDEKGNVQAIESIERNARAQAQLIEDLLDVSRIAVNGLGVQREVFELGAVLSAAMDVVLPAANAKHVDLVQGFDPADLGLILGDPKRLQQVFWNLLGNAVKFTKSGGRVELAARREGDSFVVTVTDTGCGIPADFLPYVFDRFRQGKVINARSGLGLGLTIVRHLVELHEGEVHAESEGPDLGARFVVRLPVGDTTGRVRRRTSDRNVDAPFSQFLLGRHVLLVEDAEDTQRVLSTILANAGARVTVAATVDEALRAFAGDPADAIVCDIGLGDSPSAGYDVPRLVRKLPGEAAQRVPAIALTALASPDDRAATRAAGFELHLVKPGPPDLPFILADLISRGRSGS